MALMPRCYTQYVCKYLHLYIFIQSLGETEPIQFFPDLLQLLQNENSNFLFLFSNCCAIHSLQNRFLCAACDDAASFVACIVLVILHIQM